METISHRSPLWALLIVFLLGGLFLGYRGIINAQSSEETLRDLLRNYIDREIEIEGEENTIRAVCSDYMLVQEGEPMDPGGDRIAIPFDAIWVINIGDSDEDTPQVLMLMPAIAAR